jgi:hypothetical protein
MEDNYEWTKIKEMLIKRVKDFDSKLLADLIVLSTKETKNFHEKPN